MRYNIVAIGGITEDIMFYTGEMRVLKSRGKTLFAFESGDKIISDHKVLYTAGGGGANAAVGLARLGLATALVGCLGDDTTAQKLLRRFKKEGVALGGVQRIKNYWSGLSMVVTGGFKNDHIIFTHRAANEKLRLSAAGLARFKTDWFYLTSLSGPGWQTNLAAVFKAAAAKKIKLAWNPGNSQLSAGLKFLRKYLKQTEVLILNISEARELVGDPGDVKTLMAKIEKLGPKIISISAGGVGAYIYSAGRLDFVKPVKVTAVNTTGAGDAFGSSLVGGLILFNGDLARSLKLAIVRSAEVVKQTGAQEGLLTLSQLKSKYQI